jgi:hypothetical protein
MKIEWTRSLGAACLALMLAAGDSRALDDCGTPPPVRAVVLDIGDGAERPADERIEQSLIAELGASAIVVCTAPAALTSLPRLRIRATLPDWQRASIRLESASAPPLERELDVSKLPPEARSLAIASATDELVRSTLTLPDGSRSSAAPVTDGALDALAPSRGQPASAETDRARPGAPTPAAPAASEPVPPFELGAAAGASSYLGRREAVEGELAARYWLSSRWPLGARLGGALPLSRPLEPGDVQPGASVHAGLESGFVLWQHPAGFELIGGGGLQASRVGFDERMTLVETLESASAPAGANFTDVAAPRETRVYEQTRALDHDWALAAAVGLEGRAQTGPLGFSLSLAGLLPIVPARSDWGDQTSLDTFGVQLRAGVWMALRPSPAAPKDGSRKTLSP